jgi:hypothetical protein
MSTIAPPSSPLMAVPPAETPDVPLLLTDDIPDPVVPAGTIDVAPVPPPTVPALPDALLPLAHGFCQYIQAQLTAKLDEAGRRMTKDVDLTMSEMATYTKGVMAAYGPTPTPYSAVVQAITPNGLPLTLTIAKATSAELVEELGRLEGWLQAHGYTAPEGVLA